MNLKRCLAVAAATALLAFVGMSMNAQTSAPASKPLEMKGMTVDKTNGRIIIQGNFCLEEGGLEMLLCTEGTKEYESVISTKVKPSTLHAGLLLLGLTPGKPAQWVTTGAVDKPVFVPPRGAALDIRLKWTDASGKAHDVPATDMLIDVQTKKPAPPVQWVFVGSDVLEGGAYWADSEGRHITVSNFASSVIDVPFESTDKNALLEFAVNKDKVPPKGTPVEVVITPVKGAATAPVARMSLGIDQFGRLELDGQAIWPEDLLEVAKKFIARHSQGAAEVRIDLRALEYDRLRLTALLKEAGMTDVTFRPRQAPVEILPRSAAEALRALAEWKKQFANPQDYLGDPAQDAQSTLEYIQQARQEMQERAKALDEYSKQLSKMLAEYKEKQKKAPEEK